MKARRVCGLLMFLLAALVLVPALMWLFWPVQAEALEGVLNRLGEGVVRDVLLRGYRLAQDYPRTVAVAAGAVALLGLALLFWPARKAPAMAVGSDWAEPEPPAKRTLQFPYPETDAEPPEPVAAPSAPMERVEDTFVSRPTERPLPQPEAPRAVDTAPTVMESAPAPKPVVAMATCPTCGAQNSVRAYFCRSCGADLPQADNAPTAPVARPETVKPHYIWGNQPLPQEEAPVVPSAAPAHSTPSPLMSAEQAVAPVFASPAPVVAPSLLEQQPNATWQAPADVAAASAPQGPSSLSPAPSLGGVPTRIVSTVGQTAQKAGSGHLRPASFD